VSVAKRAFNVASGLAQFPQTLAPMLAHTTPQNLLQAALLLKKDHNFVYNRSALARNRVMNFAEESKRSMQRAMKGSKLGRGASKALDAGFILQRIADSSMTSWGWTAAYLTAVQKGRTEAEARKAADAVLGDTQPNMREDELSPIFRKKGGLNTVLRYFATSMNSVYQIYGYKIPRAIMNKDFGYVIKQLIFIGAAQYIVRFMYGLFNDDDDKEENKIAAAFHTALVEPFTTSLPGNEMAHLADWAAKRVITGKKEQPRAERSLPLVYDTAKFFVDAAEAVKEPRKRAKHARDAVIDLAQAAGYFYGAPTTRLRAALNRWEKQGAAIGAAKLAGF
jgi:hypothetical protein